MKSTLSTVYSGGIFGVDAFTVEIEVNAAKGDFKTVMVGLPDAAVRESLDRVFTALVNSGFTPPFGRTTVNLAPADVRKEGPSFDLPIALGCLPAIGQGESQKSDTVNEVIKNAGIPCLQASICLERFLYHVSANRPQRDGKEKDRCCNPYGRVLIH